MPLPPIRMIQLKIQNLRNRVASDFIGPQSANNQCLEFFVSKGLKGRPPKENEMTEDNYDPNASNFAGKNDPMTHSTALYYQRK